MMDKLIYACGQITIFLILFFIVIAFITYIKSILKKQRKIKCLCHHEYEPYIAFRCSNGTEYKFKCRKCNKVISLNTVTDDRFKWAKDE